METGVTLSVGGLAYTAEYVESLLKAKDAAIDKWKAECHDEIERSKAYAKCHELIIEMRDAEIKKLSQVNSALDNLLRDHTIERDDALAEVKKLKALLLEVADQLPENTYTRRRLKMQIKAMELNYR